MDIHLRLVFRDGAYQRVREQIDRAARHIVKDLKALEHRSARVSPIAGTLVTAAVIRIPGCKVIYTFCGASCDESADPCIIFEQCGDVKHV